MNSIDLLDDQKIMTDSPEPNQPDRDLRRRIRELDWRVQRLEATQMPARSIDDAFQQVYDELDELQNKSDAMRTDIARLEGKIDTILQHLTGMGN
jgi:chromosome segregation ATPase